MGSNPGIRVNDLPGPHNFRRWTVDRETFEDGAWGTPTGVCSTTIKCRQTSTQSSATTEEMLELRRYNTQQTAVSLSTKLPKSCSLAATTDLEPPGIKRRATAVDRRAAVQYLSNVTYRVAKRKIREVAGTAPGVDGKPTVTFTSFVTFLGEMFSIFAKKATVPPTGKFI